MSKVISSLKKLFVNLWHCFALLCDWLKNLAPFSQPTRNKTNRDLLARIFPRLAPAAGICCDWFNALSASVAIGQSNYFGYGLTTLN